MDASLAERAGLRERKKQRTREALVGAALDLFQRNGFEATTVDDIAEAVEVSPRTFFRYFASKEDVALTIQERQADAFLAAFAARPLEEPVVTALRHAAVDVLRAFEEGRGGFPPAQVSCLQELLQHCRPVLARSLEQSSHRVDALARQIAERMGVDLRTDARPVLVAAVAGTALQVAVGAWREREPDVPASELVDRAFALLEDGINYPAG
jgi:AcrR family transcriptional regulator